MIPVCWSDQQNRDADEGSDEVRSGESDHVGSEILNEDGVTQCHFDRRFGKESEQGDSPQDGFDASTFPPGLDEVVEDNKAGQSHVDSRKPPIVFDAGKHDVDGCADKNCRSCKEQGEAFPGFRFDHGPEESEYGEIRNQVIEIPVRQMPGEDLP